MGFRLRKPKPLGKRRMTYEEAVAGGDLRVKLTIPNTLADVSGVLTEIEARVFHEMSLRCQRSEPIDESAVAQELGVSEEEMEEINTNLARLGLLVYEIPRDQRPRFEGILGRKLRC